jgi:hypothetical protein
MGFMDEFRRGRAQARAARGAPPLDQWDAGPDDVPDERIEDAEQLPARVAELTAALCELTEYAEQLRTHVAGLETVAAPLVAVLLMPGIKAMLVNRFHPDKHPEANAEQRAAYGEALRVINEAYAVIEKIQASE